MRSQSPSLIGRGTSLNPIDIRRAKMDPHERSSLIQTAICTQLDITRGEKHMYRHACIEKIPGEDAWRVSR